MQSVTVTPNGQELIDETVRKYVHLEGRVRIGIGTDPNGEQVLKLDFVDEHFNLIPGLVPVFFYSDSVKFKHVHLIAEFNQEGFERCAATLQKIDPYIENWDELERSSNSRDMNASGPPKSRG